VRRSSLGRAAESARLRRRPLQVAARSRELAANDSAKRRQMILGINSKPRMERMRAAARRMGRPHAAADIAEDALRLVD